MDVLPVELAAAGGVVLRGERWVGGEEWLVLLHDRGRDIRYAGPITRALETGPDGYFVAHGIEALPPIVRSEARLQLSGSTRPTPPVIDSADILRDPRADVAR